MPRFCPCFTGGFESSNKQAMGEKGQAPDRPKGFTACPSADAGRRKTSGRIRLGSPERFRLKFLKNVNAFRRKRKGK
jgi:hypothetical protein